jgi:hypothetical protein
VKRRVLVEISPDLENGGDDLVELVAFARGIGFPWLAIDVDINPDTAEAEEAFPNAVVDDPADVAQYRIGYALRGVVEEVEREVVGRSYPGALVTVDGWYMPGGEES